MRESSSSVSSIKEISRGVPTSLWEKGRTPYSNNKQHYETLSVTATIIMFRLLIRPQTIARMQVIGYLERQPTYRRLFSTDFEPEQENADGKGMKGRLWDRVFERDKRPMDLGKEFKAHEIAVNNAIKNLSTRVETGFAGVETNFARLESKISFLKWQMGLVGSALLAFLGFTGYIMKRVADIYILQAVKSVNPEAATESKDASNGV